MMTLIYKVIRVQVPIDWSDERISAEEPQMRAEVDGAVKWLRARLNPGIVVVED